MSGVEGGGSRAVRRSGGTSSPGGEGCVQQREAVWEFSLSGPVFLGLCLSRLLS